MVRLRWLILALANLLMTEQWLLLVIGGTRDKGMRTMVPKAPVMRMLTYSMWPSAGLQWASLSLRSEGVLMLRLLKPFAETTRTLLTNIWGTNTWRTLAA